MKTYEVGVWQTYSKFTTVTVQADNEVDAKSKAMKKADFDSVSLQADEMDCDFVTEKPTMTEEQRNDLIYSIADNDVQAMTHQQLINFYVDSRTDDLSTFNDEELREMR